MLFVLPLLNTFFKITLSDKIIIKASLHNRSIQYWQIKTKKRNNKINWKAKEAIIILYTDHIELSAIMCLNESIMNY